MRRVRQLFVRPGHALESRRPGPLARRLTGIALLAFIPGCNWGGAKESKQEPAAPPPTVIVAEVPQMTAHLTADFVARTDEFRGLAHNLAMQIAAQNPLVVREEDLPEGFEGLPTEAVLMLQPYIKDLSKSIKDLVNEAIGKTGENIQVRRFARFEIGE